MRTIVVCRNDQCPNSYDRAGAKAKAMRCTQEFFSAWIFFCDTCGALRTVTKDQIGGTFGSGQRNDAGGPAYQPGRYVRGGF